MAIQETAPAKSGLSFTERKRLEDLPDLIARLESEIAKLSQLLADPDLFTREPVKFRKATEALTERQTALEAAEKVRRQMTARRERLRGMFIGELLKTDRIAEGESRGKMIPQSRYPRGPCV